MNFNIGVWATPSTSLIASLEWPVDQSVKTRFCSALTVVLEEECGYREWIWFPHMSLPELVDWWASNDRIADYAYGKTPQDLPGDTFLVETDEAYDLYLLGFKRQDCCKAWINNDEDSYLVTPNRELVVDRGFPKECCSQARRRLSNYLE